MFYQNQLSFQRAHERLKYDPESGSLIWRIDHNRSRAGKPAGTVDKKDGYPRVHVDRIRYLSHRVIWLMKTGVWPVNDIDHCNLDRGDNRWVNLRSATRSQNIANTRRRINNTSGYKGVHMRRDGGAWLAQVRLNGKTKYLGTFPTPEAAHIEYAKAATLLFREYANLGLKEIRA